jgi:endonuclease-3
MLSGQVIIRAIKEHFPDPRIELKFDNRFELLIVVLLSAQTTDKKVNEISPALFREYPDADSLAKAEPAALHRILKPLGFFRRKADLIMKCSRTLVEEFLGRVPGTLEELIRLPGVGRKTASAILVNGFDRPALVVDTHVIRLAHDRLKLSRSKNPDFIEKDLAAIFAEKDWGFVSNGMVLFGRHVCTARNPKCRTCALLRVCPYEKKDLKGS